MRVTQWGEYGIHISTYLGEKFLSGSPVANAAEISEEQGIAIQYAQQILLRLREGGIIESVRGPRGGYRLVREPDDITLYDVLLAAEGGTFEVICETKPLSLERCHGSSTCNLRSVWYGLRAQVDSYLKSLTIKTLLEGPVAAEEPDTVQLGNHRFDIVSEIVEPVATTVGEQE